MADIAQDAGGYAVEGFSAVATSKFAHIQYRHQSVSYPLLETFIYCVMSILSAELLCLALRRGRVDGAWSEGLASLNWLELSRHDEYIRTPDVRIWTTVSTPVDIAFCFPFCSAHNDLQLRGGCRVENCLGITGALASRPS